MSVEGLFHRTTDCLGITATPIEWHSPSVWIIVAVLALLSVFAARKAITVFLTLRALAVTPTLSRYLSTWVKSRDYSDDEFMRADGAGERWVELRKQAINRLSDSFQAQCPKSIAWGNEVRESFSDLRFTDANRVPFPFMRMMRETFDLCSVVTASDGPKLRDLDGNWSLDVSGSYGLNVAGFDHYKEWAEKGWEKVKDLGPGLGTASSDSGREHRDAQDPSRKWMKCPFI